jgi:hypothetical protein
MHPNRQRDLVLGYIDEISLGWLAGIWEGEGHFGYDRTQLAHIRMTDLDVILKVKALIEITFGLPKPITLLENNPKKVNEQITYGIQTYGATARAIMRLVLPLMGKRRRAQIWRSLNEYRPPKIDLIKALNIGQNN